MDFDGECDGVSVLGSGTSFDMSVDLSSSARDEDDVKLRMAREQVA